jgi:hypothetical protein
MKVPRQYLLVLLVKIGYRECKAFGSGQDRAMKSEGRREIEQGPLQPITPPISSFSLGRWHLVKF